MWFFDGVVEIYILSNGLKCKDQSKQRKLDNTTTLLARPNRYRLYTTGVLKSVIELPLIRLYISVAFISKPK